MSLLAVAVRVLTHFILNRMIAHLVDKLLLESQFGVKPNRETVDIIYCFRQVSEKEHEKTRK